MVFNKYDIFHSTENVYLSMGQSVEYENGGSQTHVDDEYPSVKRNLLIVDCEQPNEPYSDIQR